VTNSTNQTGDFNETISRNSTEPPEWRWRDQTRPNRRVPLGPAVDAVNRGRVSGQETSEG